MFLPEAAIDYIESSYVCWRGISMQAQETWKNAAAASQHSSRVEGRSIITKTCGLTSLEGCREAETSFLRERILGYTVPKQKKLFIRGRLVLSAYHSRNNNG